MYRVSDGDMFFKNIVNIYYFHIMYQSTSSSEYLFFSSSSGLFNHQLDDYSASAYQLHH